MATTPNSKKDSRATAGFDAALAHSGGHLLLAHLSAAAEAAQAFAKNLNSTSATENWARLAGLWHDLGKYRPGFQRYLRASDNTDAHIEGKVLGREKTHSAAGALWAMDTLGTHHGERGKLAARVCGAHRKAVIAHIKGRLLAKRAGTDLEPLRVVSTQLVKAGVDIDFPVVFRALAGLDAIAQAAERCNREGRLAGRGRVVVFVPPTQPPPGHLRKAAQACISTLHGQRADPLARALFANYFRQFYSAVDLDAKRIVPMLKVQPDLAVQFRSAAEAFRLVDDEDSATVVVRYAEHAQEIEKLLASLAANGPARWLMRKLQRYTVSIHQRLVTQMLARGELMLVMPGLYLQVNAENLYHPLLGLVPEADVFNPGGFAL